jgi:formamidopyrimidine-DNA glycosylase
MIEIPEAKVLSKQLTKELLGKKVHKVIATQNPHKFAWFSGNPVEYDDHLMNKSIEGSNFYGGQIELIVGDMVLVFSDGVNLHFHKDETTIPKKHQLLILFEDHFALSASISMYGGLMCTPFGKNDNQYYQIAKEKPSIFSEKFGIDYFLSLFSDNDGKLSLKAFLATNQRIPGLGNGVLQDILFNAGYHPKKKVISLIDRDKTRLFNAIKNTLVLMTERGGRDTEKDLYGNYGGYKTILSKNTVGNPCKRCGAKLVKEAYLGGSIYYCSGCQEL